MSFYSDQIEAIKNLLSSGIPQVKQVYAGDFDVIANYPAITIDLRAKSREIRGIGGLFDTTSSFNIYIYANKPNYFLALEELESLVEQVENILSLHENKRLGGLVDTSNLTGETEFGVTDRGGALLQTAMIQFTTRKLGV